jgi:glycosyltransferase involved in cell wall biosynthesis
VPPGDANALCHALDRVLADEPLRLRLIDEGLRSARSFTLERYADQIVEELQLLQSQTSRAASD